MVGCDRVTTIIPAATTIGVTAEDIVVFNVGLAVKIPILFILNDGAVTCHEISTVSNNIVGAVWTQAQSDLDSIQMNEVAEQFRQAVEISVIDNMLHIRYLNGICLAFGTTINGGLRLFKEYNNVGSLDGKVWTFSKQYMMDRLTNTTVPVLDGTNGSHLGASGRIVVDGVLYDESGVVDTGSGVVTATGIIVVGGHSKYYDGVYVSQYNHSIYKCSIPFGPDQIQYIDDHKAVGGGWSGVGELGYVVAFDLGAPTELQKNDGCRGDVSDVKYYIKDGEIVFEESTMSRFDTSDMNGYDKVATIYESDTTDMFMCDVLAADYMWSNAFGLNFGYSQNPWVEFSSWADKQ